MTFTGKMKLALTSLDMIPIKIGGLSYNIKTHSGVKTIKMISVTNIIITIFCMLFAVNLVSLIIKLKKKIDKMAKTIIEAMSAILEPLSKTMSSDPIGIDGVTPIYVMAAVIDVVNKTTREICVNLGDTFFKACGKKPAANPTKARFKVNPKKYGPNGAAAEK